MTPNSHSGELFSFHLELKKENIIFLIHAGSHIYDSTSISDFLIRKKEQNIIMCHATFVQLQTAYMMVVP
jgi:hypothetical protein